MNERRTPRRMRDELDALLRRLGSPDVETVSGIFGGWSQIVGEQVARHATPVKLDRGRLHVDVDDPAWATHVKFLERDICSRVSQTTGTLVSGIEVRVSR